MPKSASTSFKQRISAELPKLSHAVFDHCSSSSLDEHSGDLGQHGVRQLISNIQVKMAEAFYYYNKRAHKIHHELAPRGCNVCYRILYRYSFLSVSKKEQRVKG